MTRQRITWKMVYFFKAKRNEDKHRGGKDAPFVFVLLSPLLSAVVYFWSEQKASKQVESVAETSCSHVCVFVLCACEKL